ncbi:hypothetical protein Bhyg_01081 [Pseudolycoriella hygida]|uniref:Type VII secretion system protein EssD-like domain-containing protein n=1 Tax=Pseudolycoriella hygida TaxID=35572 RepID=A0A9Q0N8S3_9DIPT|nr:hypothetical protein Bhyg_01081 [Pseudolycoriella hygida]
MFVIKCIPFVGTAVNACEAVGALVEGDGNKFFSKLAQTGVGAVMDTAFVMSGGMSSLVTAPLKGGAIEGGKVVSKKVLEQMIVKEAGKITTNVAVRAVTEYASGNHRNNYGGGFTYGKGGGSSSPSPQSQSKATNSENSTSKSSSGTGSGNGNDPPKQNPKLPGEHEADEVDYDYELQRSSSNPITEIHLGPNGRVEELTAIIKKHHLRPIGQGRRHITSRVRRFVNSLGQVFGHKGVRDSDEVGHIIGDLLGGPSDQTYNFFPQSPHCNMDYYHKVENEIYDYLKANESSAHVEIAQN